MWLTGAATISASGSAPNRKSTALAGNGIEELLGQTDLTKPTLALASHRIELLTAWAELDWALALAGRGVLQVGTGTKLGALAHACAGVQDKRIEAGHDAPTRALRTPQSAEELVKVGRKPCPARAVEAERFALPATWHADSSRLGPAEALADLADGLAAGGATCALPANRQLRRAGTELITGRR